MEAENISTSVSDAKLKVLRRKGGSGKLTLKINTESGSAKNGADFEAIEDLDVEFEHEQLE